MSISAANMSSIVSGAASIGVAGQYAFGPGDVQEPAFVGQSLVTGDGANTAVTINFIDGTNAIPFVPTGCRLSKIGGNDTNNGIPVYNSSTALNNVAVGAIFSAAPANAKTVLVLVELYK